MIPPKNGATYTEDEKMAIFSDVVFGHESMDVIPEEFKDEFRRIYMDMLHHPEKYFDYGP